MSKSKVNETTSTSTDPASTGAETSAENVLGIQTPTPTNLLGTSAPEEGSAVDPALASVALPAQGLADEFHGQGGEYEIVNGVRRLVSRTEVIDPTRAPDVEVNPARAPSNA